MVNSGFSNDFRWGAATAAYQIEGGVESGGRGASVWDMLCRQPGRIYEGHTGLIACDHFGRWKEDIEIMKAMGLKAYRFSVAWPRVIPDGEGAVNPEGLAFYDRLVDGLLEADIEPCVTLFHWDFPHALYQRGGWLNAESPAWFANYARVVVDALSDRVSAWMTFNEPQCFVGTGHQEGTHAPGDKLGWGEIARAAHHVLLAHGRACSMIREHANLPAEIGFVMASWPRTPADGSASSLEAAMLESFVMRTPNVWSSAWWLDPVVHGHYPEDGLRAYGVDAPKFSEADLREISAPVDFIGLNIYSGGPVRMGDDGQPVSVPLPPGCPTSFFNWKLVPESLYWGPKFFYERYGLPVWITENGMSAHDWISLDGRVHDPQRIDYIARYLAELRRAAREGVPVGGYFAWSLLDNFEWAEGYKQRFGLVYVDYATGRRTPKDSAAWYADVIRSGGAILPELDLPYSACLK
jgi:beta-glucosidase